MSWRAHQAIYRARFSYLSSSFIPQFFCRSRVLDQHAYQESEARAIRVPRKLIQVSLILRIQKTRLFDGSPLHQSHRREEQDQDFCLLIDMNV